MAGGPDNALRSLMVTACSDDAETVVPQCELDVVGGIGDDPFAVSDAARASADPVGAFPLPSLPLLLCLPPESEEGGRERERERARAP